jgi:hypothetical protein
MLLELIENAIGGSELKQISRELGEDETKTENAIASVIPMLVGALTRNSLSPSGASSLDSALARDHDGGILEDISSVLGSGSGAAGDGILRHVLGEKRSMVEAGVSRSTGMDMAAVGKLLTMLAPVVMGALGRVRQKQGLAAGGLSEILKQETSKLGNRGAGVEGLLALLDADGDGDVLDDVGGILGKLLGGR